MCKLLPNNSKLVLNFVLFLHKITSKDFPNKYSTSLVTHVYKLITFWCLDCKSLLLYSMNMPLDNGKESTLHTNQIMLIKQYDWQPKKIPFL
jgi:hypothetical protein